MACHVYVCFSLCDNDDIGYEAQLCWDYYELAMATEGIEKGQVASDIGKGEWRKPLFRREGWTKFAPALSPGDVLLIPSLENVFSGMTDVVNSLQLLFTRGIQVAIASEGVCSSTDREWFDWLLKFHAINKSLLAKCHKEARLMAAIKDPLLPVKKKLAGQNLLGRTKTGRWSVYCRNPKRFSQAMLALRELASGKSFKAVADIVERQRRIDDGLMPEANKSRSRAWWSRTVHRLAWNLPHYLPLMRLYYGERDEYYLDLTPVLRSGAFGTQKKIPPIPRPALEATCDERADTNTGSCVDSLDVLLPRDGTDCRSHEDV